MKSQTKKVTASMAESNRSASITPLCFIQLAVSIQ